MGLVAVKTWVLWLLHGGHELSMVATVGYLMLPVQLHLWAMAA